LWWWWPSSWAHPIPIMTAESPVVENKNAAVVVRDVSALVACVRRLEAAKDVLVFRTTTGMRLMVRPDDDTVEVAVVCDMDLKAGEALHRALLESDPEFYDDGSECTVVVGDFEFPSEAVELMGRINAASRWFLCPCARAVVKDAAPRCYYCELTAGDADADADVCPICREDTSSSSMVRLPCCGQFLHAACKIRCEDAAPTCPLCRASL
jgi:hypothetical protein